MEWTCARCGQCAAADDWATLTSIGWSWSADGDCLCVSCIEARGAMAAQGSSLPPELGIRPGWQDASRARQPHGARAARGPSFDVSTIYRPVAKARHLVLVR